LIVDGTYAGTDRDIGHIQRKHDLLIHVVDDPLAPPFRHQRDPKELDRLRAILDTHDQDGKGRTA
jgi:hypothetical protein